MNETPLWHSMPLHARPHPGIEQVSLVSGIQAVFGPHAPRHLLTAGWEASIPSPAHARGRPPSHVTRTSSTPRSHATAWATANGAAHRHNHHPAAALVVCVDEYPGVTGRVVRVCVSQAPFAVAQAVMRRGGVDEVRVAGLGRRPRAWAGERGPGPPVARPPLHDGTAQRQQRAVRRLTAGTQPRTPPPR